MSDFGLDPAILDDIKNVLGQFPEVLSAGIYGSRAKGTYKDSSDIDLAVHAPNMPDQSFARLSFELNELSLIFKMDVVHVDRISNEELLLKIKRDEKIIYEKV